MESQKQLLEYAYNMLARRPHTVAEIRQKFRLKKIGTPEEVENMITRLIDLHYLDDAAFAQAFVHDALLRKPQGLAMLRMNLKKKGVSAEIIHSVVDEKNIHEITLVQDAIAKKRKSLANSPTEQQKAKLYRFLCSRGFSYDAIKSALRIEENGNMT